MSPPNRLPVWQAGLMTLAIWLTSSTPFQAAEPLTLAADGQTAYCIVQPTAPSEVDAYAVREFAHYLGAITGVEFEVIAPAALAEDQPAIFLGLSDAALTRLGHDPRPELADQEHVNRTHGQDLLLYGQGLHGNLYAAFAFLKSLGWRWYSVFEHPVVPSRSTLSVAPFERRSTFSFAYRLPDFRARSMDYLYQNAVNMGFDSRRRKVAWRHGEEAAAKLSPFQSEIRSYGGAHSLLQLIEPQPVKDRHFEFEWVERDDYFATNPEYFSLGEKGERVPDKQLCFSNHELRAELTRLVLQQAELVGAAEEQVVLAVTANDTPGRFCWCDGCRQFEQQYQSPGGPLYDYLIELCGTMQQAYPKALIKTLAYRLSQTQQPPVLPPGQRLPPNLIVDFAPIDDCYFADWWTHRDEEVQATYQDLLDWGRITDHLWAWIYPNPWGTGIFVPVGNVERLVNNVRLMKAAGVERVFADHNGDHQRANFAELQNYLLIELLQDVDADVNQLIREFTDNMYGPAAPLMRQYIAELEAGRKAMDPPPQMRYKSAHFDLHTFPYLTIDNIHRWQALFDRMERLVAADARFSANLGYVRRELDLATLWRWHDLRQAYPQVYTDYTLYTQRFEAVNSALPQPWMNDEHHNRTAWETASGKAINRGTKPLGEAVMRDFVTRIEAGGQEKPLPDLLDGIDRSRIKTFAAEFSSRQARRMGIDSIVTDADAAFGFAAPVIHAPGLPFPVKLRDLSTGETQTLTLIEQDQITPGVYRTYELGTIEVKPRSRLYFRWGTTGLDVGRRLYAPGEENRWKVYVSLKFDGPTYGGVTDEDLFPVEKRAVFNGAAPEDLILADRFIFVRHDAVADNTPPEQGVMQ